MNFWEMQFPGNGLMGNLERTRTPVLLKKMLIFKRKKNPFTSQRCLYNFDLETLIETQIAQNTSISTYNYIKRLYISVPLSAELIFLLITLTLRWQGLNSSLIIMHYFAPQVNLSGFKVENYTLNNSTFLESNLKPQFFSQNITMLIKISN